MENDRHGQRWSTWMLARNGMNRADIHRQLVSSCGDGAPSIRTVQHWIKQFSEGRTTADDEERSGRPGTSSTPEIVERIHEMITEDPRITIRMIAYTLGISYGSVSSILHEQLHLNKMACRWVPRTLTPQMKRDRVASCRELLALELEKGPGFFDQIVTGDESWFHYYEPESKRSSMEWREVGSAPPTKVHTSISVGKRMATVFWDKGGILLIEWLPQGRMINSEYYCEVLRNLREAIKNKRRGKLARGVLLQQDNARPHTSAQTMAVIRELGFTVLPHPPYFPDLAPSDYWLFGEMKKPLRGKHYDDLQQLSSAVGKWVRDTPNEFFATGLNKLHERWTRCVDIRGDWVESHANDED